MNEQNNNNQSEPVVVETIYKFADKLKDGLIKLGLTPKILADGIQLAPKFSRCYFDRDANYRVLMYKLSTPQIGVVNPTMRQFVTRQAESQLTKYLDRPVKVYGGTQEDPDIFIGVALDGGAEVFLPISVRPPELCSPKSDGNLDFFATASSQQLTRTSEIRNNINAKTIEATKKNELPKMVDFFDYVDTEDTFSDGELNLCLGLGANSGLLRQSIYTMNNLLIAGSIDAGKSSFMQTLAGQGFYAEFQKPGRVKFALVDKRGITFNPAIYEGLPQLIGGKVLTKPDEIVALLSLLGREMTRRANKFRRDPRIRKLSEYNSRVSEANRMPVVLVFIEEMPSLTKEIAKNQFLVPLLSIMEQSRKYGIYFINCGPKFPHRLVSSDLAFYSQSKFALGHIDEKVAEAIGFDELKNPTQFVKGRGVCKLNGYYEEFQALYLDLDIYSTLLNHLRERAGLATIDLNVNLDEMEQLDGEDDEDEDEQGIITSSSQTVDTNFRQQEVSKVEGKNRRQEEAAANLPSKHNPQSDQPTAKTRQEVLVVDERKATEESSDSQTNVIRELNVTKLNPKLSQPVYTSTLGNLVMQPLTKKVLDAVIENEGASITDLLQALGEAQISRGTLYTKLQVLIELKLVQLGESGKGYYPIFPNTSSDYNHTVAC